MPKSREKFRFVTTMRASISTCGVAVSSSAIRPLAFSTKVGRSRMITVLVRSSMLIWPRADSAPAAFSTVESVPAFAYEMRRV